MKADVIIIGSGFGGSVAAARLAGAGLKVIVIERGPWRKTVPVVAAGLPQVTPLPRQNRPGLALRNIRTASGPKQITINKKGLLELHVGKGIKTLASSGVGGGSHLWAGLVSRPVDPEYWNNRAPGLSEQEIASHYQQVSDDLGAIYPENAKNLPNHTSYAWCEPGWFEPIGEQDQYPVAFLFPEKYGGDPRQNRVPSDLLGNDGVFGSPNAAKATVDVVYLLPHLDKHLKVLDLHEVESIENGPQGQFLVNVINHRLKTSEQLQAPRVVLAAGSMNSVKILCESQEQGKLNAMQSLGKGFGTNGDCMGVWEPNDRLRNSTQGTPVHGRINVPGQAEGINLILAGSERPPLPKWLPGFIANKINDVGKKFQIVAMGVDQADGRLQFSKGRLHLEYDMNRSPVYEKIFQALDKITELSGAPVKFDRKSAMTAHPMGGCRIGNSSEQGVIDGKGQVYGNPGLYVTDASAFPAPTGGPPTLSIAAWSSYVAAGIIEQLAEK